MKKKRIPILVARLVYACLNAQISIYTSFADSTFLNLHKPPITTGILYNRVYPAAGPHAFNITTDTVNSDLFQQAYFEMYYATHNPGNQLKPSDLSYIRDVENFEHRVPIGILTD